MIFRALNEIFFLALARNENFLPDPKIYFSRELRPDHNLRVRNFFSVRACCRTFFPERETEVKSDISVQISIFFVLKCFRFGPIFSGLESNPEPRSGRIFFDQRTISDLTVTMSAYGGYHLDDLGDYDDDDMEVTELDAQTQARLDAVVDKLLKGYDWTLAPLANK